MASMIVLYGRPENPASFDDHFFHRHIPFAVEHLPDVTARQAWQVLDDTRGEPPSWYRIAVVSFASVDHLRAALDSEGGRALLADLDNFATGGATVLVADD